MGKYLKLVGERVKSGRIPIGYDPYNKTDVTDLLPTLPTSYGVVGHIGTTLIFEERENETKEKH